MDFKLSELKEHKKYF